MEFQPRGDPRDAVLGRAIAQLYDVSAASPPWSFSSLVDVVCDCVGSDSGRLLVADYGLRRLQDGPDGRLVGPSVPIEGTIAGRAFDSGSIMATSGDPTVLHVPLVNGTERIGLLELQLAWDGEIPEVLAPLVRTLVLLLVTTSQHRCVGAGPAAEPLSAAAEVQWDLLPPLAGVAQDIAVGGILKPRTPSEATPSTTPSTTRPWSSRSSTPSATACRRC